VLSFPQFSNIKEIFLAEKMYKDHKMLLGDIIICKNIAKKQAEKIGNTVDEEILYLTIHSILHILGYNHENMQDKKLMRKREKEILEKIRSVSTV
jgi:probable rRNA maturation factor